MDSRPRDRSFSRRQDRQNLRLLLDITEKKETELALQQTRLQLSEAQRLTQLGYWERDFVRNQGIISEEALRILGGSAVATVLSLEECDREFFMRIHPDDLQRVKDASTAALEGIQPYDIEFRLLLESGEERYVHSRGEVLRDSAGKPLRWFGTIQEISAIRRVERELYESESRFRLCLDHASDMLMLLDRQCRIVDVNKTACDSLGYTREELIGHSSAFFDYAMPMADRNRLSERLSRGEAAEFQTRHRRKDGSEFPVEVRIAPVKNCGNVYAVSLASDITERQNSQRMVTDNHRLMRAIVNGTSDVIYAKGLEGHYLLINTAGANLFGLKVEDVLCRRDCDLPLTEAAKVLLQSDLGPSTNGRSQLIEQEVVIDGKPCTFLSTRFSYYNAEGTAIGTIGISRDVTEIKQLGDALRHSQKMEAVGSLAGGIAHDFNNLLTVIISYSELLLLSLEEGDPQRHQVNEIFKCGERAAALTRQLLAFSRKQKLQPQVVNLRDTLDELSKLLRTVIGEDIELNIHVDDGVPDVKMDVDQFQQSIANLAVNARDAMPHGGKFSIEVSDLIVQPSSQIAQLSQLKPGRYARISVSDTGIGMSESVQARVFEPFFTTKPVGKGSGLGLSMTYGFVTQSGGHIEVSSSSGNGTTFRLYLPCAPIDAFDARFESNKHVSSSDELNSYNAKETVLLVEDEDTVRALCCRILEACGYSVLEARDGLEALELLRTPSHRVDLLLTDVVMPRMNGPKLQEAIQQDLPQLPVLFMSGYADDVVLRDIPDHKHNFMRKPFSPRQLAERVRALLNPRTGRL